MNDKTIYIHVDGACSGNPGPASVGIVLREVPDKAIAEIAESIGHATNNEAEYLAVLRGLAEAKTGGYRRVRMYSDSELVARQVQGAWACRQPRLERLRSRVLERSAAFESFDLVWVPRTQNRTADRLATQALDVLLGREGRQDEFTFHNFQRLQEENQRIRAENQRLQAEIQMQKENQDISKDLPSQDFTSQEQPTEVAA